MEKLFDKEQQVIKQAEKRLETSQFDSKADQDAYELLYEEYKALLRQVTRMVHLSDRIQLELRTLLQELERVSKTDPLTNLYNRSCFMKYCLDEWERAQQNGHPLAVLMIDVDFFKEYNDTYGHIKGDACLKNVANQFFKIATPSHNMVARFGGDEFVVLLSNTNPTNAAMVAQNILVDVRGLHLEHHGSKRYSQVTLSIGVASMVPEPDTPFVNLLQHADQALYQAKEAGKNCVRLYAENVIGSKK